MLTVSMKRARPLLAIPLLALGLTACGSTVSTSGFKGEAHAVAQRISDLQTNVTAVSEQKICGEDLSSAARARLNTATAAGGHSAGTCEQAIKRQIGSVDDYELTVEKVTVSGTTATAVVRSTWSGKLGLATLTLVKERGGWRISGIE
jgi:3-oxoacyl-ACP reductase-like protein